MEGYQYLFNDQLVTVWSAPNYCYRNQNAASILTLQSDGRRDITLFRSAIENYSDPAILHKISVSCLYLLVIDQSLYADGLVQDKAILPYFQ